MEQFLHTKDVCNRYKMDLIKKTIRALIHASKVMVRTDAEGLLCLQFLLNLIGNQMEDKCFVEYYIDAEVEPYLYES